MVRPWARAVGLLALMTGCANHDRDNSFDPVNTPHLEMSTPVLDGGSILLQWRYLSEGDDLEKFRINRTAGVAGVNIGFVMVSSNSEPVWQTAIFRDSSLVGGVQVFYEVAGILKSGVVRGTASGSITIPGTEFSVTRERRYTWLLTASDPMELPDNCVRNS